MKKTLILGASTNPERYAYKAAHRLTENGHAIVPVGIRDGEVAGEKILTGKPQVPDIDTVTMYLNPAHQPEFYEYVLGLKPRRIIFNPGAENTEFELLAQGQGIQVVEACTLVLLSTHQF
jgi:uncharacterized protein